MRKLRIVSRVEDLQVWNFVQVRKWFTWRDLTGRRHRAQFDATQELVRAMCNGDKARLWARGAR